MKQMNAVLLHTFHGPKTEHLQFQHVPISCPFICRLGESSC